MKIQIRNQNEFWSGILFIGFGLIFLLVSPNYEFGSPARIGPGFFPTILSSLLIVVGLATASRGFYFSRIPLDRFALRPLILVTLSIVIFAVIINTAGALITIVLMTFIASLASEKFDLQSRLILAIVLATFSILVFILGLGMPIPIVGNTIY